ncbi:LLM class flavin-dependent oxidoreductase [Streptomyces sp. NPDC001276]|uniref:LLM class flavin-dependent oxidoreductase n=1 Tax=Streptomyces sp. NPDC001276 TaxID=3364555 RepID=UPI00368E7C67
MRLRVALPLAVSSLPTLAPQMNRPVHSRLREAAGRTWRGSAVFRCCQCRAAAKVWWLAAVWACSRPVVVAKQAATLDVLSAGRFSLGVGVGWSAEEFAALGVPFARRGRRTEEYLAAMRTLWTEDPASFAGEFTRIDAIRVNPKPLRGGRLPVVVGGNSDAALRRAVTLADGPRHTG